MSDVCITAGQRRLHMTTEAIAVFTVAPLLLWATTRTQPLGTTTRAALGAVAVGTLLVDGYLLIKYAATRPGAQELSGTRTRWPRQQYPLPRVPSAQPWA